MTTVGVIGGGQLGQMLGYAGQSIGVECVFLEPASDPPAARAGRVLKYAYDDPDGLKALASNVSVITYEFENVPVDALATLPPAVAVYPPAEALRAAQDRLLEKQLFSALDIPTPPFFNVESKADLDAAASQLGYPFVLKTRRLGYDGKGQAVVDAPAALDAAWQRLGSVPLLAEAWVEFDFEVSAIGARTSGGDSVRYPLTENRHRDGILRSSRAPAGTASLTELAHGYHQRLMARLDYVGVLALELFVVGDRLLANEFAPRVHNSGHWTIDGAAASQFENHLRAVLGWPLGDPAARGHAGMENLLGTMPANLDNIANHDCFVHDYGKAARPGRKLGHVTVVGTSAEARDQRLEELQQCLYD